MLRPVLSWDVSWYSRLVFSLGLPCSTSFSLISISFFLSLPPPLSFFLYNVDSQQHTDEGCFYISVFVVELQALDISLSASGFSKAEAAQLEEVTVDCVGE